MTSQNAKIEDAIFFLISLLFAFQGDDLEIEIQLMRLPRPNKQDQKLKVKNKNDMSKCKIFNLCSVILHFYFCIFHFEGVSRG
jgi:hypothetical protein